MVSMASLGGMVVGVDQRGRKKDSAEEREEEIVTVSGVRGGRVVVGMDTCGGAGGFEDGGGSG